MPHTLRAGMEADLEAVSLKVDFQNAFNVTRSSLLAAVAAHAVLAAVRSMGVRRINRAALCRGAGENTARAIQVRSALGRTPHAALVCTHSEVLP
jgi:hypothetical protein